MCWLANIIVKLNSMSLYNHKKQDHQELSPLKLNSWHKVLPRATKSNNQLLIHNYRITAHSMLHIDPCPTLAKAIETSSLEILGSKSTEN